MKNNKNRTSKIPKAQQADSKREYNYYIAGLDQRSIIIFRFCLGFLLFYNLLTYKFGSFQSVFAPQTGFLGNDFVQHLSTDKPLSWLRFLHGDFQMYLFFFVAGITYLLFAFNVKPLFTSLLAYFCYSSVNIRYFPVRAGWDYYIDVLLFLSVFLSFHSNKKQQQENTTYDNRNVFSFLIIFQIGIVYFFAAISKYGINWKNGTAVAYILGDMTLNKPAGIWLLKHTPKILIKVLTYGTLIWEYSILFLLFFPFRNQKLRIFTSFSILVFHWSINLFADVGHFKYVTSCAAFLLLPGIFWDKIPMSFTTLLNRFQHKWSYNALTANIENNRYYEIISKIITAYFITGILLSNILFTIDARNKNQQDKQSAFKSVRMIFPKKSFFFSQNWAMYSPSPISELGVLKMEALTEDGKMVNLINPSKNASDIFTKDFATWKFENQLLTLFKARIIQEKDEEVIKRWFRYYINRYMTNRQYPRIKTAYLYLYSITNTDYFTTPSGQVHKTEIIKADIVY